MSLSLSRRLGLSACGLGAAAFVLPISYAFAQEERELVIQAVVVGEKGEKEEKEDDDDDDEKQSSFWMGIALKGSEGANALTIAEVFPESPALKAGLKLGDILLAIDGNELKNLEQLVDSVQDSQGKTLKVKFSREGKEQVTEVHPAKRPGAVAIVEHEEKEEKGEKKEGNEAGSAAPGGSGTMPLFTQPRRAPESRSSSGGSSFPPGVPWGAPRGIRGSARMVMTAPQSQLPDDMEVSISKKGNKPAVIVAKQGDKLWKTTENELGMLPPPAQAYASRLLGKDVIRTRARTGGNPGMMPGMSGGMGLQGMSGAPTMIIGGAGTAPAREMRQIELRLNKDGKVESAEGLEEGKNAPHVKVLPGGGIQVEIREGDEGKEDKKPQGNVEKEDPDRAQRVRALEEQRERLRGLVEELRKERDQKDRDNKDE